MPTIAGGRVLGEHGLDPGVENQYQGKTVYTRGAMTLHALRGKIGDDAFSHPEGVHERVRRRRGVDR